VVALSYKKCLQPLQVSTRIWKAEIVSARGAKLQMNILLYFPYLSFDVATRLLATVLTNSLLIKLCIFFDLINLQKAVEVLCGLGESACHWEE
jgi:hypothetical protein